MRTAPRHNQSGFTLVELLIAIAIFVTALTAASAIFTYANKSQRVTKAVTDAQSDARFSLEVMAQQIRRGSIDYASSEYGGTIAANPQDVLVLRTNTGSSVWFRRSASAGRGIVEMSEDGVVWAELTPPSVSVDILKFYLSPATDPFVASPAANEQPRVTITMVTSSTGAGVATLLPTYIQTTVASRQYVR
ncbi:MAG: prepilin-type N-terminal cleavage/methylation domain-containing protein [Parcubacteria group bacterium]|nr:prepilin-type N-terminal cleavage/methylation domain-containing protein [Parcubacteria group bacterium]